MVKKIITAGTKPRWLAEKYLATLDDKFRTTYNAARIKFRLAWANGQKEERSRPWAHASASPATKKEYTDLGNWLIIVYDALTGADKLDPLERVLLEKKVYEWSRINKSEDYTEDFKDWEYNNKFFGQEIENPLTQIIDFL